MRVFDGLAAYRAELAAYMSEPACKCGCAKQLHLIGGCPSCTACSNPHDEYRFEKLVQKVTAAAEPQLPLVVINEERKAS